MPPMGGSPGLAWEGTRSSPLYADWPLYGTDPNDDFWREGATIVNRSWHLYRNNPYARAMVECLLAGVLGASGLVPRSLYQADASPSTSEAERAARRAINLSLKRAYTGTRFDAVGQLAKRDMSFVALASCVVAGDAFAIRQWKPNRPGRQYQATCWRLVDSTRVSNKGWSNNNDTQYEGLQLDADGVPIGVWIQRRNPYAVQRPEYEWDYVPMYAADGSRNVVHIKAPGRADQLRGVGWFAPIMALVKQLGGVTDAYVVAKRLQASMGLIVEVDDAAAAASGDRNGAMLTNTQKIVPGMVKYVRAGTKITPLNWQFQGTDHSAFADSLLRSVSAAWGLPFELVQCRLSDANLAAARAALMAAYRTFHGVQELMIAHIEQPWAESVISEDIARGRLDLQGADLDALYALAYSRPSKQFPDPVREATAGKLWADQGKSPTTTLAEQGLDFEQEVLQSHQDREFASAHGVPLNTSTSGPGAPAGNDGGATESIDGQKQPGQTPPAAPTPAPDAADVPDQSTIEREALP
jgi:lambda family phage portal protein